MRNVINLVNNDINPLLKKYSVKDIETSLIKIFLEINNLNTKNGLLLEVIRKNHNKTKEQIKEYLQNKNIDLNLKTLERFFELLIEQEDRKINGAYYTPSFIVDYMVDKVIKSDVKVCDCSCGSGAFLVSCAEKLKEITMKPIIQIIEGNLYGSDISKSSVYRTKILLSLLSLMNNEDKKDIKFNLVASDSLKLNWRSTFPKVFGKKSLKNNFNYKGNSGFDIVIGNPPYVRIQNLDDKTKEFIRSRWTTAEKYNVDLYIPFIELSLDLINTNGEICLITAKSYFDSEAGKQIRKMLRDNKFIEKILDFNFFQIFEDVITYTSIIHLNKKDKENLFYHKVQSKEELNNLDKIKFTKENYKDLPDDKIIINGHKHIINLKKIIGQEIKLSSKYPIRVGIATLRDKSYLISKIGNKFIKEHKYKKYEIEKELVKKLLFANNIKSRNERKELFGWIIFPYEFRNGKYKIIAEPVLKQKYPLAYTYFRDIKKELMKRDKGRERIKEYGEWYAYGRVQGYNAIGRKLICPNMMPEPRFEILNDNSLFIAGYGIICNKDVKWLNKILNSEIFWYYVKIQGKKIRNEFYVVGKKLLGDFSIPNFTENEKNLLIKQNQNEVNDFLKEKYEIII